MDRLLSSSDYFFHVIPSFLWIFFFFCEVEQFTSLEFDSIESEDLDLQLSIAWFNFSRLHLPRSLAVAIAKIDYTQMRKDAQI